MNFDETWIVPERGAEWLKWGFGTRHSVLRNEPASVKQVHGARVLPVTEVGVAGEADALETRTPGLMLGIKTADCLPILLADLNLRAVAAVHAGWRGTAQGIVSAAVCAMEKNYGTKPINLLVALGPAIGKCCFEVGSEVAEQFADFDSSLQAAKGKAYLDLHAINTSQLQKLGVPQSNILQTSLCTVCDREKFWSYRREKENAGRMWSLVGIEE